MKQPSEVKPYLAHSDPLVRGFALRYFEEMASGEPDLMPRVLEVLPTVDQREQRRMLMRCRDFIQTPASMERLGDIIVHQPQLRDLAESLFLSASPMILAAYSEFFPMLSHMGGRIARRRVQMLKKDSLELLDRLKQYAMEGEQSWDASSHADARYLLRELMAREDAPVDALRSWALDRGLDEVSYREILGVAAARYGRFWDLSDLLVDNFAVDDELLNEETGYTLTALASPDLIKTIVRRYPHESWHVRMWIGDILGRFKDPLSEQGLLVLLADESDPGLRLDLAMGLCDLLSLASMDAVRSVIAEDYRPDVVDLMEAAYANLVIQAVDDPNMGRWRMEVQAVNDRIARSLEEWD